MNLAHYSKAIAAAITAGYGAYQVGAAPDEHGISIVTQNEWVAVAVAAVLAALAVFAVPNTSDPEPVHHSEPDLVELGLIDPEPPRDPETGRFIDRDDAQVPEVRP